MKFFIFAVLSLLSNLLYAQQKKQVFELTFHSGYASTDFNWSIAGNSSGQSPDVLSEVKWKNISGVLAGSQLKINLYKNWFVLIQFTNVFVKSGNVTDSDYAEDGRKSRTYYAELRSNEGSLNDFNAFGGYHFFNSERLNLGFLAGYKWSRENLLLLNKNQPSVGEKDLRSTYQTSWKGFSTGLYANYKVASSIMVNAKLIYSQLKYNAEADWNLIDAFKHPVSFTHYANGFGLEASLSGIYRFNNNISLQIKGKFSSAETGTGVDQLFLESGSTQITQFNGVERNTKNFTVGIVFNIL